MVIDLQLVAQQKATEKAITEAVAGLKKRSIVPVFNSREEFLTDLLKNYGHSLRFLHAGVKVSHGKNEEALMAFSAAFERAQGDTSYVLLTMADLHYLGRLACQAGSDEAVANIVAQNNRLLASFRDDVVPAARDVGLLPRDDMKCAL